VIDLTKQYINTNIEKLEKKDIKKIQDLIEYHSNLYYNKQDPIISDSEYDILYKKLQFLEEKFNIKSKESLKVWATIIKSTFKKVAHSRPMISLDNTYNEEDLCDFDERVKKIITSSQPSPLEEKEQDQNIIQYTLEFKFDWLGVELIYKNWELIQAITRGNWVEGEDVTQNVFQIDNIPKKINYKEHLEVRGEVVMPISVFNKLNTEAKKTWDKVFSNPRNAASWSLRLLDNSVTKKRKLKFFAYDLANFDDFTKKENIKNYFDVIKDLEKFGFDISSYFLKLDWIDNVIKSIDDFWDVKKQIDFEIDGLVLKVNDISLWKSIWSTEHHPRYAIAYKFPAEIMTTTILSVEHSVWRTGTITPIAHLEPINIWWVIVKRATLHNYEEVENLWVKIWDNVFIKRAWEVIPKIISVASPYPNPLPQGKGIEVNPPKICPSCSSEVLKDEDKVRYYCSNKTTCPAQDSEKLAWSVGKQWFNIDWFWEKQVELFLSAWIIKDLSDVFNIEDKTIEILELEWFQEKSVDNLINAINKAKKLDISRFLTALWISWVGKKTAKTLAKLFTSSDKLLNFNYNIENLEKLEDIWPEIAKNVLDYFNNETNKELIIRLLEKLDIEYYTSPPTSLLRGEGSKFYWKKMCITWSFNWYSRDQLIEKLEQNGWEFVWSVSKKTDYLLVWEKAWSKLKKAQELWIEVLNLTDFINTL